jgi:PHP family Zn ribbon phosphoesterase
VTVRCNPNVIAVAVLKKLAGVVVAASVRPDELTANVAQREGIPLFATSSSIFDTAGRLWSLTNSDAAPARTVACDLHVHTCLSPCADDNMGPEAIVEAALEQEINVIAVCDHNSAENVEQVVEAAAGTALLVIPGIEIASDEEVHIVVLFPTVGQALAMQKLAYGHLAGKNVPEKYGDQRVVDRHGRTVRLAEYMLIGKTDLKAVEILKQAGKLGGLAIAAHVDRPIFSVATKFGGIPDEMKFDALEVSPNVDIDKARAFFAGFPVITSSDSHTLDQIGRVRIVLDVKSFDFEGVREALLNRRFSSMQKIPATEQGGQTPRRSEATGGV